MAAETAQTVDRLIRLKPQVVDNDLVVLTTLHPALDWLADRLRALSHHPDDATPNSPRFTTFIAEAAGHVASFCEVLAYLPAEKLRVRAIFDIADACGPSDPSTTAEAVAAKWTVVSRPSEVWGPEEAKALSNSGAQIVAATERERLHQAATLRGKRTAATVICF